ncbi:MAG: hypothetical protein K0S33_3833 [Bacteroidetes bacterium]|jgi:CheY-like chemotaxis protein|nr:hypothetical protein [Bacteroidota bacterium]
MKTILLVDDDYLDIESIRRTFAKMQFDHSLYVAHNGVDALGMLTPEKNKIVPDIILLDINMPKMNGFEFLRIIKNYSRLKNIMIFIIATTEEEYEKMIFSNMGVEGYIRKPLTFNNKISADVRRLFDALQTR